MAINVYLLTMDHNSTKPVNHGLVKIDDSGYINEETPIEDFGMYITSEKPFPESEEEQFQLFIALLAKREKVRLDYLKRKKERK